MLRKSKDIEYRNRGLWFTFHYVCHATESWHHKPVTWDFLHLFPVSLCQSKRHGFQIWVSKDIISYFLKSTFPVSVIGWRCRKSFGVATIVRKRTVLKMLPPGSPSLSLGSQIPGSARSLSLWVSSSTAELRRECFRFSQKSFPSPFYLLLLLCCWICNQKMQLWWGGADIKAKAKVCAS